MIDPSMIRAAGLKVNEFAIPKLPYVVSPPDIIRENGSTRAMITYLINKKMVVEEGILSNYQARKNEDLLPCLQNSIANEIQAVMQVGILNACDESIISIIHKIQMWGGRMGRQFYIRNGQNNEFDVNAFPINSYKKSVDFVLSGDVGKAVQIGQGIPGFGISFASKHFSFWTQSFQGFTNNGPKQLPILDSIISRMVLGVKLPNWGHYPNYVRKMYDILSHEELKEIELTVHSLERQLFNFEDTDLGRKWLAARTN